MSDSSSPSLHRLSLYPLSLADPGRNLMTNSVRTMLAISYSIEDAVMGYRIPTVYYAGFQRLSAFLPQIHRYSRLAAICGKVVVFAYPDAPVPDVPGIQIVPLEEDAPLAREWFIVVDSEPLGIMLLTRQLGSPDDQTRKQYEFGRGRAYEGVVTYHELSIAAAHKMLAESVGLPYAAIARPEGVARGENSPYNFFHRSLVLYLEERNRHLVSLYQMLSTRTEELERLQGVVRTMVSQTAWEQAQQQQTTTPTKTDREPLQESLTVLFADVQGFTRLTESDDPPQLLRDLNRYLDILATTVYQEGGDVDKFTGDGMMAFFRDPLAAVEAAILIQKRVDAFNAQQIAKLRPSMPTRLGLASGACLMGWVGSRDRQELTVLGDTANLASRLQGLAPVGGLVMDEHTFQAIGRPDGTLRLVANIKGKQGLQTVYEVSPENSTPLHAYLGRRRLQLQVQEKGT